jgi:hypothetical protein
VKNNTVRFFLIPSKSASSQSLQNLPASIRKQIEQMGGGGFGGPGGQNSQLTTWVQNNCKVVPGSLWQTATPASSAPTDGLGANNNQLYDCSSVR